LTGPPLRQEVKSVGALTILRVIARRGCRKAFVLLKPVLRHTP
jgi:hypothetical protein